MDTWSRDLNSDFTLKDCLFRGVEWAKNADLDKYVYSGYGIGFNSRLEFSLPDGSMGKNVIMFGIDMSSSVHLNNKGKDILILGKGPTQGLDHTALLAEAQSSINFSRSNRKCCLVCVLMGATVLYLLMLQKYINSREKILKWKNISWV